jgi:ABC-2 type transport system ATP-binding protein
LVADDTPEDLIAKMSPKGNLCLCAEGDIKTIEQTILAIPQVEACRVIALPKENYAEFVIESTGEADIARQLFFALAEIKCPIRRLTPVNSDLEKVFMRLTQDRRYENGESI